MLTAKEALAIAEENKDRELREALESIKKVSLRGEKQFILPRGKTNVLQQLESLGYRVEIENFSGGYFIKWDNPKELNTSGPRVRITPHSQNI